MSQSTVIGASVSQDTDIQILNRKNKKTKHLSLGQIRGVVQLFATYFKPKLINGRQKRLSKQEKASRWVST